MGCSFTLGDTVEAEKTFSYLTAEHFQVPSHNYGVCSCSYASAIRQLEELDNSGVLAQLKPSTLVLGAGDWLVAFLEAVLSHGGRAIRLSLYREGRRAIGDQAGQ